MGLYFGVNSNTIFVADFDISVVITSSENHILAETKLGRVEKKSAAERSYRSNCDDAKQLVSC